MARKNKKREAAALEKDIADSYNKYKMFEGKEYTGMKIGRSHKWYYDEGVWHDKKITPDKWRIDYSVTKRRAGHAPEGSGAEVGTQYHWLIIAHQVVTKLNADNYSTSMTGLKYKIAFKRADKEKWDASDKAQRRRTIKILKELLDQLEHQESEEENVIPLKPAAKAKSSKPKLKSKPLNKTNRKKAA
jgi:hypothetical protein